MCLEEYPHGFHVDLEGFNSTCAPSAPPTHLQLLPSERFSALGRLRASHREPPATQTEIQAVTTQQAEHGDAHHR